jgi:hypothetical protein
VAIPSVVDCSPEYQFDEDLIRKQRGCADFGCASCDRKDVSSLEMKSGSSSNAGLNRRPVQ